MANNVYTEVTHESWSNRLGGSIKRVLLGLLLVAGAVVLLFWNEGRSVKTYRSLTEGASAAESVSSDSVDPAREGRLVHLNGTPQTSGVLVDPVFAVADRAIKLRRRVEMYQWVERKETRTEKKLGGGKKKTSTYRYVNEWSEDPVDSARFQHPSGHENPTAMEFRSTTETADEVRLGAFTLSRGLVSQLDHFVELNVDETTLPQDLRTSARAADGGYYLGENPASPRLGDLRVSFSVVRAEPITVVAGQEGSSFRPYATDAGRDLEMLELGELSSAEIFDQARSESSTLTWILRAAGLVLMAGGFMILLAPLAVLADVVPFLGTLVGSASTLVAALASLPISLVVVGTAWIVYRPLLGAGLLAFAAVAFILLFRRGRSSRRSPRTAPAAPRAVARPDAANEKVESRPDGDAFGI